MIDADGLNLLADHMELLPKEKKPFVLTPHMKEMAGLLGCTIGTWEKQICCVKRIYRQLWCCLCTEGCTYACGRKRPADVLNTAGNSAMAKAGSGDVLAGVITGFWRSI